MFLEGKLISDEASPIGLSPRKPSAVSNLAWAFRNGRALLLPRRRLFLLVIFSMVCVLLFIQSSFEWEPLPPEPTTTIFVLTPTYSRPTQLADLTRLCNTLRHIPSIFWIVIEDTNRISEHVKDLLDFCRVPTVHLAKETPKSLKKKGRGVNNRNEGLRWLRENARRIIKASSGVIYFADDDNAYDLRLFDEIRKTRPDGLAMFPVGCIFDTGISTPVVHDNGTLLGFLDPYRSDRKYIVDMAGFAVGLDLFLRSNASFVHLPGKLEDRFLRKLNFKNEQIQFLAASCTRVLVWHVKTVGGPYMTTRRLEARLKSVVNATNIRKLLEQYSAR